MSKQADPSKFFAIYIFKDVLHAVVMLPEVTEAAIVTAAWSYAVTFSAKGLNRPDYDAAVELLKQRHPSWNVVGNKFTRIDLDLAKADDDLAEA